MLKAMSTYVYVNQRLHPGLLEGMVRAGAEAIEIFAFRGHFDYAQRRQHVLEIANWFKSTGTVLNSLHSPMYNSYDWSRRDTPGINIADPDRKRRIEAMDEIKHALEVAEHVPYRFLVQHIGVSNEEFDERKFEAAMTSIEHLRAFANPLGVKLLVENIPNELSTPERILELLHVAHFDDVGVCFDTGHAHILGDIAGAFATLKNDIRSTHVHDNKKDKDTHLWPGEGNIDWNETMKLLASAPHVPPLLLEIEGQGKTPAQITEGAGAAYRKLEQASAAQG
jgi:sugar phosphate isomerase/epimerase